jgi:putative flippase GtrA
MTGVSEFWVIRKLSSLPEVMRFGLTGLISNLVYFGILFALLSFDIVIEVAGAVAYLASMVTNFQMHARYTFGSTKAHAKTSVPYLVTHGVGMIINSTVLHVLITRLAWSVLLGQALSVLLVAVWSFFAMKYWAFRQPR